jgi:hypothetical protein
MTPTGQKLMAWMTRTGLTDPILISTFEREFPLTMETYLSLAYPDQIQEWTAEIDSCLVPRAGLEPARLSALEPKSSLSTNSNTWAALQFDKAWGFYYSRTGGWGQLARAQARSTFSPLHP